MTTGGDDHETFVWQTADGREVRTIRGRSRAVWISVNPILLRLKESVV